MADLEKYKDRLELPMRSANPSMMLTDDQRIFLDCVILGLGEARILFQRIAGVGRVPSECNKMYSALMKSSYAQEYMQQRRKQLLEHLYGDIVEKEEQAAARAAAKAAEEAAGESDKPKDLKEVYSRIVKRVTESLAEDIENGKEVKTSGIVEKAVMRAFDSMNEQVVTHDPPKIYLPEDCLNCRYRIFIEEGDEVEDECQRCRYRIRCKQEGYELDIKEQLINKEENGIQGNS